MDTEYTNQLRQCEMCQPNWHLGDHGDFEAAVPLADLAKEHAAKVARAGLKPDLNRDLMPAPEAALLVGFWSFCSYQQR